MANDVIVRQPEYLQLLAPSDSSCGVTVTRRDDLESSDLGDLGHPSLSHLSLSAEDHFPIDLRVHFNRVSHVGKYA